MKRALLVIDYTVDFVAENGALTCGEPGRAIEGTICRLIESDAFDCVFAMNDTHEAGDILHPESALFPPHNLRGSHGAGLYGAVNNAISCRAARAVNNAISGRAARVIEKTRYSAFCGTPLDLLLRERGIADVTLCGVCTDICVLHTAIDAYNLGYHITVVRDAVASFDQAAHETALKHFEHVLGADVCNADDIIKRN